MSASSDDSGATDAAYRRALLFIFITITVNSMGIGLIMPVMPDLLLDLTLDASIGDAAWIGGWLTASYALAQFVMSPVLGNLSDAYGRRSVLLLSLLVMTIDYAVMAMAQSLWLLFAARIMAGAAAATFSTANAYIADISPPEKRAANFGLTGAAFGLGFVLGPAIGGVVGEFGPRMPFVAAAILTFGNMIFGYVALPESLKPENRRPFSLARSNSIGAALQMRKYPAVAWMLVAMFFYNLSHYVWPVVWSYFAKERFGWSPVDIGIALAAVGLSWAFVQGYLIRVILKRIGETRTALLGFAFDVVTLVCVAFVTEGWMVFAFIPFTALSALVTPAMQGLMSNRIPDDAQGELQGAVAAIAAIGFVITPIVMAGLFQAFTSADAPIYFPGAPFLAAAALSAFAILPFLIGQKQR